MKGGSAATGMAAGLSAAEGGGVALLAPALVKPFMDRAVKGFEAGPVATSAMLYSARSMYRVAMESDYAVTSYLVCYSALALAALFKSGPRARGQRQVDGLLMAEDPSIVERAVARGDGSSSTTTETEYTEARNQFIHAEDRGADPAAAALAMTERLAAFRDLTARILRKL